MLKSIQIKIVLIFLLLGIAIIVLQGGIYIYQLQSVNKAITDGRITEVGPIQQELDAQNQRMKLIMVYGLAVFSIVSIAVGIFVVKVIIGPISKIIKVAEKIKSGETINMGYLNETNSETEIDDLVKAFSIMTNELQENLNEATRQKKQIETILLHMTDGIIAFSREGDIIHINPAATRFLGLTLQESKFDQIFEKRQIDVNIEKIIYLEDWTSSEQKVNIQDRVINLFFAPFKDENERPAGVIVLIQDITEHVKLDKMRKEFVADVSHELKTPITSIMGYAETLLESEYEKETQEKFLHVISTESKRMARLVADLLTLSQYDNDEGKWEKSQFNLSDLVKQVKESLALEIKRKGHIIESFVTANVPMVYADRYGIERVLLNILTNSIKYTQNGGNIKIYIGFVYNDAYVKIIDNGVGIPEEDLNKIFERFYRVDKARTREMGGTGLGLPIAKEILDKNGGSIDIKSMVNKGTEVVIRIPTK